MSATAAQYFFLAVIQGITEWLPISSSGHLALLQNAFGFQDLAFDVFLHLASVLAVIILFRKDIKEILSFKKPENTKYILLLILATIPAGIVGFLFKDKIAALFSSQIYLGVFFIISGLFIYMTKFSRLKKENPNWLDSLLIGIAQAAAVFPAISRSGSTISMGLYRGLKKETAIKFAFLMSIPVILGAGLLEAKDIVVSTINPTYLITSFVITFVVSIVAIKVLLRIMKTDKFYLFGVYNMLLGIFVILKNFWF